MYNIRTCAHYPVPRIVVLHVHLYSTIITIAIRVYTKQVYFTSFPVPIAPQPQHLFDVFGLFAPKPSRNGAVPSKYHHQVVGSFHYHTRWWFGLFRTRAARNPRFWCNVVRFRPSAVEVGILIIQKYSFAATTGGTEG